MHNDITRDFIQIFRDNNDLGETRTKHTPSEEQIEKNLNSFHDRWINVPSSPLTSATQTELENLRQHIRKGCLNRAYLEGVELNATNNSIGFLTDL